MHRWFEQRPPMAGRVFLWLAWACPAALTIASAPTPLAATERLVVGFGTAGLVAFLPGVLWTVAAALTVAALPFTLWWCGFAAAEGAGPGYEAAVAAVTTHADEAVGAFRFVARLPSFWVAAAGHLVCLSLAARGWLRGPREAPRAPRGTGPANVALLGSLLPLAALALATVASTGPSPRHVPLFGEATLASPLGSAEAIADARVRLWLWHRERGYRRVPAPAARTVTAPVLAVFALGESVRAEGYGPGRRDRGPASRALAARIDRGLGAWLPRTCAASNGTHLSVPMLLTATPPERHAEAPGVPTVLGQLKADGFRTAWLSNNEAGEDAREAGHDLYAGAFTANPDDMFTEPRLPWTYDEDVLPVFRTFVGDVSRPTALVVHLRGSHIPYEARYPGDRFAAEPPDLPAESLEDLRYERSLEYGASVILSLAAVLDETPAPAFLVYTSDHGENLRHDHNGLRIHLGPRTSAHDGTVPSFVLWNRPMAESGAASRALGRLVAAREIAHADVARLFLVLAGAADGPAEPTATPTIWAKPEIGADYRVVPCASLAP